MAGCSSAGLADGEEIPLARQRDEVQAEAVRGCLHADARIGHAAGDMRGDRHVRELAVLLAVYLRHRDVQLAQHQFDQVARAGADLAVDEAARRGAPGRRCRGCASGCRP